MNTMRNDRFAGDKKKGDWFLAKAEKRMVNWMAPRVPSCLETYHLTLFTLLWSIGIVACSFLARENINWLWAVSLFIFLQYISDVLDGAVCRYRDTGLVKWGYYMDRLPRVNHRRLRAGIYRHPMVLVHGLHGAGWGVHGNHVLVLCGDQ